MKKAFFSFVTVTLVALVLFLAASYLFAFRDLRNAAEKDLEFRKVAERAEDVREAVNRSIMDAVIDAGYLSYGCGTLSDENSSSFCGNLTNYFDWYFANASAALSDSGIAVNITRLESSCATNMTITNLVIQGGFSFNVTKNVTISPEFQVSSKNAFWRESFSTAFRVDLGRGSSGPGISYFVARSRNFGINGTNTTVFVQCP